MFRDVFVFFIQYLRTLSQIFVFNYCWLVNGKLEYVANEFNEIAPLCTDKCQTISTFGIAQQTVSDFFSEIQPRGVDRVIPLGQSMAFSLHWDGYQLPELLTRRSTVMPG